MNIFSSLQLYAGKYQVTGSREFSAEEKAQIKEAVVAASTYGNSVCFMMKTGGQMYIPLSNDSTLGVGEIVDIDKAKLITLSRQGDSDIVRVSI